LAGVEAGKMVTAWSTEVTQLEAYVVVQFAADGGNSGNWTTRGYANSRIANSRTGHLADW